VQQRGSWLQRMKALPQPSRKKEKGDDDEG